ncbi:acyl-CoA carboxylase subunit epsilon [Actinopolyspora biskrensis]|uniref:acyl-CoA carboxylase subunit epsilon n=1 Tax=Actinopolyspora biskrensis TaxID=1470178 RepID=UPI0015CEBFCD
MSTQQDSFPFRVRVEKGEPDPFEIGALAAVIFRRAVLDEFEPPEDVQGPKMAPWRRPERFSGVDGPRSWQKNPR